MPASTQEKTKTTRRNLKLLNFSVANLVIMLDEVDSPDFVGYWIVIRSPFSRVNKEEIYSKHKSLDEAERDFLLVGHRVKRRNRFFRWLLLENFEAKSIKEIESAYYVHRI